MIYGRALVMAQVYLLPFIPEKARILIVGGGTGWILEEITKLYPAGLKITYAEVAPNMMSLSQKRNIGGNNVVFINDAIENISLPENFDVIITAFLFDNFKEQTVKKVFEHIDALLKTNGIWLNADFQLTGKWWQSVLLKSMLLFFKILCNIEASHLPETGKYFKQYAYQEIGWKTFFNEFIISKVFKKKSLRQHPTSDFQYQHNL